MHILFWKQYTTRILLPTETVAGTCKAGLTEVAHLETIQMQIAQIWLFDTAYVRHRL